MRLRSIPGAISAICAATACGTIPEPGARTDIPCHQAFVSYAVPGSYTCQEFSPETGLGGGETRRFNLYGGASNGTTVSLQVVKVWGIRTQIFLNQGGDLERSLREYSAFTKRGSKWSALRTVDGYRVIDFEGDGRSCYAFSRYGGDASGGYDYHLRGTICALRPKVLTDDDFRTLAGAVVVK
jgi:hypothetical protein